MREQSNPIPKLETSSQRDGLNQTLKILNIVVIRGLWVILGRAYGYFDNNNCYIMLFIVIEEIEANECIIDSTPGKLC